MENDLLNQLKSPESIASLSDDEDSRFASSDEHQLLGSCVSDPSGFNALVSSGRLPVGLHRAIILSPAAHELIMKLVVAGRRPLLSAWEGLLLSTERTAGDCGDLIPAAIALSQACCAAAKGGTIPSYCVRTLESLLGVASALAEGKKWGDCYRTASERRGLADLAMLAMRLLQTFAGSPSAFSGSSRPSEALASKAAPSRQPGTIKGFRRRQVHDAKKPTTSPARRGPAPEQLLLTDPAAHCSLTECAAASQARMLRLALLGGAVPRSGRMAAVLSRCLRWAVGATRSRNAVGAVEGSLAGAVAAEVGCRLSALRALARRFGATEVRGAGVPPDVAGAAATLAAEAARREHAGKARRHRGGGRAGADLPGLGGAAGGGGGGGEGEMPDGSDGATFKGAAGAAAARGAQGEGGGRKGKGRRGRGRRRKMRTAAGEGGGPSSGGDKSPGYTAVQCSQRVKLACDVLLSGKASAEDLAISAGCSAPAAAAAVAAFAGARAVEQSARAALCGAVNRVASSVAAAQATGMERQGSREQDREIQGAVARLQRCAGVLGRAARACEVACLGAGDRGGRSVESLHAGGAGGWDTADWLAKAWMVLASADGQWRLAVGDVGEVGGDGGGAVGGDVLEAMGRPEGSVSAAAAGSVLEAMLEAMLGGGGRGGGGGGAGVQVVPAGWEGVAGGEAVREQPGWRREVAAGLLLARGEQPKGVPVPLFRLTPAAVWGPVLRSMRAACRGHSAPLQAGERLLRWSLDALAVPVMLRAGASGPAVQEDVLAEMESRRANDEDGGSDSGSAEEGGKQGASGEGEQGASGEGKEGASGEGEQGRPEAPSSGAPADEEGAAAAGYDLAPLVEPPAETSEAENEAAAREQALSCAREWRSLCSELGSLEQSDEAHALEALLASCLAPGGWRSNGPGELRDYLYGRVPEEGVEGGEGGAGGAESVEVAADIEPMAGIMVPLPPMVPDPPSAAGLRGSKSIRMAMTYRYGGGRR